MKKIIISLLCAVVLTGVAVAAEPVVKSCPQATAAQEQKICPPASGACKEKNSCRNGYNMMRGVVNIGTCFWEIPRCMILGNSDMPFWGFIAGAVSGVGDTTMRCFSGVTDLLFLGFEPGRVFDGRFRQFVWQSQWKPDNQ